MTTARNNMSKRSEAALERHHKGYNCAQAVACTFCDKMGMDEKDVYKMAEGFGFGMGAKEVCGAVSGMIMAAGFASSNGDLENPGKTKKDSYKISRELEDTFRTMNSSIYCHDLLGGPGRPKLRSCDGCVEDAANILAEKVYKED